MYVLPLFSYGNRRQQTGRWLKKQKGEQHTVGPDGGGQGQSEVREIGESDQEPLLWFLEKEQARKGKQIQGWLD